MIKKLTIVFIILCSAISIAACGNSPMSEAPSSSSESSKDSTIEVEDADSTGTMITQEERDEIFGDIPRKYQEYDKFTVAQPKRDVITTYIYIAEQEYITVDTPIPDYMITVGDYLIPISEELEVPEIDRIVYDLEKDMICVNFASAIDDEQKTAVLESIRKTIIENQSGDFVGVYFELNMKPYVE